MEDAPRGAFLVAAKILSVDQMVLNWGGGQLLLPPDLSVSPPDISAVTKVSVCGADVQKVNSNLRSSLATRTLPSPPGTSEAQTFKPESRRLAGSRT